MLETLSEYISPQEVFDIVNSTSFPGWGYMIDRGATTIWETWKESDNTYSNCHPMFGTVTEWYYRWLGGIRPDPQNPGFKSFFLIPFMPQGLKEAHCTYHSPFGKIVSKWEKQEDGYQYELSVPQNSTAKVTLPISITPNIQIKLESLQHTQVDDLQTGTFELEGGDYLITVLL